MAWEHRGTQSYYYRSVRSGRRVTKTYVGTGPLAAIEAAMDAQKRAERQAKVDAWQQARQEMEALDAQFTAWWTASSTLIDAYLIATGYYRHERGPWRKRAEPQSTTATPQQGEQGR